jgi:5-methylcytosine-specific restriction endonuclease McrA
MDSNIKVEVPSKSNRPMTQSKTELLDWLSRDKDQALYYRLFSASFYLNPDWEDAGNDEFRISRKQFNEWMTERLEMLNKKNNNNPWEINKNKKEKAKYPINAPLRQAIKQGNEIARNDRKYVYISKEILQFSLRYEPALKKYAVITMSDRVLEWSRNPGNYSDAKEAVENMLGVRKRLSIPRRFGSYMATKLIGCIYCKSGNYEAADHTVAWDRWGKRGHHEANWVPSCTKCNGNKTNKILGLSGWKKILDFYKSSKGQDFVIWAKEQLENNNDEISWKSHFEKVKVYHKNLGEAKVWHGYDKNEIQGTTECDDVCKIVEEISKL